MANTVLDIRAGRYSRPLSKGRDEASPIYFRDAGTNTIIVRKSLNTRPPIKAISGKLQLGDGKRIEVPDAKGFTQSPISLERT